MKRLHLAFALALVASILAVPAFAETDRVGSLTAALWCNDGASPGYADRLTEATVCQRDPAVPGPSQCPEFVDRVLLEFDTEHARAHGRIFVEVEHFDADGNLLEAFRGSGRLNALRADVSVDIDRATQPGEWIQATIRLPRSARKLVGRECAVGSLTVLE